MNKIKQIIKQNKLLIKKIYSTVLLIMICLCVLLSIYWYIKPRSVEAGENHPYSEKLMKSDKILIYDQQELRLDITSTVNEIVNIGVYGSRQGPATKNSIIKMSLRDDQNNELFAMEYKYSDIDSLSVLALFPKGLDELNGKSLNLNISTSNIDETNPLIIYKADNKNDGKYYLNDTEQEDYLAYIVTGNNPSYFYVWYPVMLLSVVLVFCSINDWSVINGKKKKI